MVFADSFNEAEEFNGIIELRIALCNDTLHFRINNEVMLLTKWRFQWILDMVFHFIKNVFPLKNNVVNLLSINTEVENDAFEVICRGMNVFDRKSSILAKKT
jgi:hypothetical protein